LHLKSWQRTEKTTLSFLFRFPKILNEEVGEMSLSMLSRKLKINHSKEQVNRLLQTFSCIRHIRRLQQLYAEGFEKKQPAQEGEANTNFDSFRLQENKEWF